MPLPPCPFFPLHHPIDTAAAAVSLRQLRPLLQQAALHHTCCKIFLGTYLLLHQARAPCCSCCSPPQPYRPLHPFSLTPPGMPLTLPRGHSRVRGMPPAEPNGCRPLRQSGTAYPFWSPHLRYSDPASLIASRDGASKMLAALLARGSGVCICSLHSSRAAANCSPAPSFAYLVQPSPMVLAMAAASHSGQSLYGQAVQTLGRLTWNSNWVYAPQAGQISLWYLIVRWFQF